MKLPLHLPIVAALAIATPAFAQDRGEGRERIHQLMEKAKQAKSEGRTEEANELMHQIKKLQAEAEGDRKKESGGAPGDKRGRMKHEIEELHRAGKHEEAERLQNRLRETLSREHHEGGGPVAKGSERLQHVMEAVQHLRAAGFNEPAADLEKLAHHLREELEREHPAGRSEAHGREQPQAGSPGEVNQLREQVERLTREMEKVREEMKRQREGGRKE